MIENKKLSKEDILKELMKTILYSEDTTGSVDMVIPWVNTEDKKWRKSYEENRKIYLNEPQTDDANSECRYRDMGTLKYVFRSIEKNAAWFNKVFLVLSDESQIPDWIDTSCKRLRIVYHNEYIPKEFLPTFNSNVIENFYWRIPDLSDNYILMNDDTLYMNKVPREMFFRNDLPVLTGSFKNAGMFPDTNTYWQTLNTNMKLEKKYLDMLDVHDIRFDHMHLMVPHQKSFEKQIWLDNYDYLYNALADSKFRSGKNITHLLFNDLCIIFGHYYKAKNLYNNSICVNMTDNFNLRYMDLRFLACFNDTDRLQNYDSMKERLLNHLDTIFPDKSMFEV